MKIFAATRPVPPTATQAGTSVALNGPMTHLFGAVVEAPVVQEEAPAASERFQLVGVIAPRSGSGNGLALVAIDGQPAKAWHVGATLDGDTTLMAVAKRSADFGPSGGPKAFTLELPEPAAPVTGTLPDAESQPVQGAAPAPPIAQRQQPQSFPEPGVQQPGVVVPGAVRGNFPNRPGFGRPGMPGVIPSNIVPPGRTAPTAGQSQIQPQQTPTPQVPQQNPAQDKNDDDS